MSERNGYIPGVPCWIDVSAPTAPAEAQFYKDLFGWHVESVMPEGSQGDYFVGTIRGGDVAGIGSAPEGAGQATWNSYVWVDSAEEAVAKARAAGGSATDPFDVMDAGRMAVLTDPEGAAICVWEPKQHRGAKVVNEHGALNFNVLATRDVDRAEAFYGDVFGWQILRVPGGGVMWTLPGYGDHLEESNPGLRKGMADMGAPDGFIDVVAAVNLIAGNDTATPTRWDVTFGVDDVEAAAQMAKELGGEVVAGHFDAPWCRMAVIKDPQGAVFTASQFVIENKDVVG